MPGFDQTGPRGGGRMSGRRGMMCRRTEDQTFPAAKNGRGRGQELGRGPFSGRGVAGQSAPIAEQKDDLQALKEQYQETKKTLNEIERKIQDLESKE